MCGIAGYYCLGTSRPTKTQLSEILEALADRGTDATGAVTIKNNCFEVIKAPLAADEFVKTAQWQAFPITNMMICHTRLATQGAAIKNANNHPVLNDRYAVVHNGIISNDTEVFENICKVPRTAEVDSEAILPLLARGKSWRSSIKQVEKHLLGSFAFAALDLKAPDTLLLFRKSNPIVLLYDQETKIIWFASTKDTLQILKQVNIHGIPFTRPTLLSYKLDDPSAMVITPTGVKMYDVDPRKDYIYNFSDFTYVDELSTNNNEESIKCAHCSIVLYESDYVGHVAKTYCPFCLKRLPKRFPPKKRTNTGDITTCQDGQQIIPLT